jgi:ABC-type branched-subunit amino acid transport system permease subunit
MSVARVRTVFAEHTILRSLLIVALAGLALWIISLQISAYNDLQLATGAYYFAALAGLTVFAGLSGQISLGHGALMAIGAYTVALLIGNEGWAVISQEPRSRSRSDCRRSPTSSPRRSAVRTDFRSTHRSRPPRWASTSRSSAGRRGSPAPARWWWCSCSTTSSTAASAGHCGPSATTRSPPR